MLPPASESEIVMFPTSGAMSLKKTRLDKYIPSDIQKLNLITNDICTKKYVHVLVIFEGRTFSKELSATGLIFCVCFCIFWRFLEENILFTYP